MWFVYALAGAFGKSYSGLFRKKLANNVSTSMFLWISSFITLVIMIPFALTRGDQIVNAFMQSPVVILGAALSLMVATFMNLEALKREELSYVAPLNAFVPVFTLIIASTFLGENPPPQGILGLAAIFIGAYIISMKPGKVKWYDPIKRLFTSVGALLSIGVSFLYAVNTVFLKQASNQGYDGFAILFCTTLVPFVLLLFVPFVQRKELRKALKSDKANLAGAAVSSFAGQFFNILAVAGTYASYAVSVRRFESIISVFLGWRYLKETNIRNKLIGSGFMVVGAVVMAFFH